MSLEESAEQIAERIASQPSVGGFSGLSENTRRIIRGAALQAARAARGLPERADYDAESGEFVHAPESSYASRLEAARRWARWHIGDPNWAEGILAAFADPERTNADLDDEMEVHES